MGFGGRILECRGWENHQRKQRPADDGENIMTRLLSSSVGLGVGRLTHVLRDPRPALITSDRIIALPFPANADAGTSFFLQLCTIESELVRLLTSTSMAADPALECPSSTLESWAELCAFSSCTDALTCVGKPCPTLNIGLFDEGEGGGMSTSGTANKVKPQYFPQTHMRWVSRCSASTRPFPNFILEVDVASDAAPCQWLPARFSFHFNRQRGSL